MNLHKVHRVRAGDYLCLMRHLATPDEEQGEGSGRPDGAGGGAPVGGARGDEVGAEPRECVAVHGGPSREWANRRSAYHLGGASVRARATFLASRERPPPVKPPTLNER